jgi:hypothetical protein
LFKNPKFYCLDDLEVSIDDADNVCLVGTAQTKSSDNMATWAWVRTSQGGWDNAPVLLEKPVEAISDLQVKHDASGNFMVVWCQYVGKYSRVYAAYKPVGKPWSPTVSLFPTDVQLFPFLQVSPTGDFVLVLQNMKNWKYVTIYGFTFSSKEQVWSSPILLSPEGQNCLLSGFVLGKNGKGLLAWVMPKETGDIKLEVATLHLK